MALGCHSVKILITTAGYSLVAMVTDLLCHLIYYSTDSSQIKSKMLSEIHTMKMGYFLKPIIHSQTV